MMSGRASQYDQMPGAFPSDDEEEYTEEDFLEMMNDVTREIVNESDGSFLNPPSAQPQAERIRYLPKTRPDEVIAALEQFQQSEQAQFGKGRNRSLGSNVAASAASHELPSYAYQPSFTAYESRDINQNRPLGGNGRTPSAGIETLEYGKHSASAPRARNQGSSYFGISGRNSGHHSSISSQQSRPQTIRNQAGAYGGAYISGYQRSPYLFPSQGPQDVNKPPQRFYTRSPAPHRLHALPPRAQGLSTLGAAVDARAQPTANRTPSANALRHSIQRFAEPESDSLSVIHDDTNSVPRALRTRPTNARQSDTPLESNDEDQDLEKAPEKDTNKRRNGLPARRCATLRKTTYKQGITKVVNGQLMWLDPNELEDKKWKPAVVMDDIRKYILRQQDKEAQALGCSYLYPDVPGGEPYGDTAFFLPHQHLGEARDARAELVFTIDETDQNNPQPDYDPGWMMYDPVKKEISDNGTVIVLGPADNPIVNWKEIPLCISPHMDGSKMEYMRRVNKAIRQQDIWARMPRWYWQKPGDPQTLRQISSANAMVNMPLQRFRQKAGCLTWADRRGSDELELGLKNLLNSTAVGRQCIAANSMRGFGRDLNGAERLLVKRGNADGKYLRNASDRAVDENTRNERRAKEDERIAKTLQAENPSIPASSTPSVSAAAPKKAAKPVAVQFRKRDRSDDEDDSEGSEYNVSTQRRPHKRIRRARVERRSPAVDDDLAMFDEPNMSIGTPHPSQRYQLRKSARQEAIRGEHARVEESSDENSPEEGEEHPDEEVSGAEAESKDDDDAFMPNSIPGSVAEENGISNEDDDVDQDEDQQEEEGDGQDEDLDDEGEVPETIPPDPILEDPHGELSGAGNAEAKESDLEAHRRWVREFLYEDQEDYASSLERRRTTQPPARYPNAINPSSPLDATTSGVNYSEVDPSTDSEVAGLAEALCPTKKMFWEWTGQTVPQLDREKSYGEQYRELRKAFEDWWSRNAEGPLPVLVGVTHWGSSVDDWEPVKKDAVYYEAYKKGHRAPRDEHGRIVDVPGPLLEKFADIGY